MRTRPKISITTDELIKEPCKYCRFNRHETSLRLIATRAINNRCKNCENNEANMGFRDNFLLDIERYRMKTEDIEKFARKEKKKVKFLFLHDD